MPLALRVLMGSTGLLGQRVLAVPRVLRDSRDLLVPRALLGLPVQLGRQAHQVFLGRLVQAEPLVRAGRQARLVLPVRQDSPLCGAALGRSAPSTRLTM